MLGAISCGLVAWLAVRTGFFNAKPILPLLPKLPFYWLWLLKEIAKSSFEVARIVLSPRLECSPTIVDFEGDPKTRMGQVILGNSITLTPGTVTLDIYNDRLVVHCLTQKGAASLQKGEMSRRVAALEAD
ncbi:MAG: Na+/H+ antiporter subunit E [Gammaproteobacteria bacterium]|nr:Na+/H+ antiporter subunit E [Gammaproteobacteria bacterium]